MYHIGLGEVKKPYILGKPSEKATIVPGPHESGCDNTTAAHALDRNQTHLPFVSSDARKLHPMKVNNPHPLPRHFATPASTLRPARTPSTQPASLFQGLVSQVPVTNGPLTMDLGSTIATFEPNLTLRRDTRKRRTDRAPQIRIVWTRTPRGITKPRRGKTGPTRRSRPSTLLANFLIRRAVLFQAQQGAPTPSNAWDTNDGFRLLSPQTSADPGLPPVSMHARGTKRPAADGELELRAETISRKNDRVTAFGGSRIPDLTPEIRRFSAGIMAGLLAKTRRLFSFFERPAPDTDGGHDVKRLKLSDDGHDGRESSGDPVHKSEPADSSFNSRSQGNIWASTSLSQFNLPTPDERPLESLSISGGFPADEDESDVSTTVRTSREKSLGSALSTSQPPRIYSPARRSALFAKFKDPRSRSHLFTMRSKGAVRPERFRASTTRKSRPTSSSDEIQSSSNSSSQSIKDEDRNRLRGHEHSSTSYRESLQETTGLTSLNDSKTLSVIEGFGDLKISGLVAEREEQERKKREREEELERQRLKKERQRDEEERAREEELRRQAKEREEAEKRGGLRPPNRDLFPVLTTEWATRIRRSMVQGGHLAETPEAKLTSHDFERLIPSTVWLNDNIVNGTLLWVDKFVNEAAGITNVKAQTRKCLMPGSFFFTRLLDHGVKGTERTLRRLGVTKDNILDIETILMPICQVHHWTLVVVEPKKRRISHFDSLNPAGSDAKRALAKDWMKSVLGDAFIEDEWCCVKYRAPQQCNGWDCGIHTVLNGLCLGLGIEPSAAYSSDQLPELRKNIAAVLLNQGFKGDFSLAGC